MIGKLSGLLDSVDGNQIILDVQGVGYVVAVSARTLREMGQPGEAVALQIETQIREDAFNLFGFIDGEERDWFRLLISVQGVGAKSALSILSLLSPDELTHALISEDKVSLTRADGVGPKLALRIITELKDKVAKKGLALSLKARAATGGEVMAGSVNGDAVSALIHLGYRRMEAFAAVSAAVQSLGKEASLDEVLRASLAQLSKGDA